MSWASPWMLFALSVPAAAAVLGLWRARHAKSHSPTIRCVSVTADRAVHAAAPSKPGAACLILVALALGLVALARPQWGERPELSFSQSIEVVIALDLSRSMWTPDMPSQTTRLRAAKNAIERLLDGMRGENVGLVVFAGTSFVQVPMSPDYPIIREFLPGLDPSYMPVGGSDYERMLGSALEGFSQANDRDRYLIVLSDGEATGPGFEARIPTLVRRNIHVIGIGFGTEHGAHIPDQKGGLLLDNKNTPVISRLTPQTLESLAVHTQGSYVAASSLTSAAAARRLIQDTVESGRTGRVRGAANNVGVERFQWFLAPALVLSLVSLVLEFPRHASPRGRRPEAAGPAKMSAPMSDSRRQDTSGRNGAPGRAVVLGVLGVALTGALSLLAAPGVQAHHNTVAGFEVTQTSTADPAQRVRAIALHMGKLGYDPYDLQLLVEAAIQFGAHERAAGRLPLQGVMQDAADAARLGKKLDPKRASWDHYDAEIHALLAPLPAAAQDKDVEHSDSDEDDDDEQNYKPVPLRKAKDKDGKDLFGKNTKSRSEFALGDLSGDEAFAPQEPHGGRRRPSKPPQSPKLIQDATAANDPTMIEARKNFSIVVKADSPARVHQLLNGDVTKFAVAEDW